jgi:hypothetical protein
MGAPPTGVVAIQIRGPGLVGPRLQIRGPGNTDPNIAGRVDQASSAGDRLLALMAGSWGDVAGLAARWPDFGAPGWLVGRTITRAELDAAIGKAGVALHVLIAEDVDDISALTDMWATS